MTFPLSLGVRMADILQKGCFSLIVVRSGWVVQALGKILEFPQTVCNLDGAPGMDGSSPWAQLTLVSVLELFPDAHFWGLENHWPHHPEEEPENKAQSQLPAPEFTLTFPRQPHCSLKDLF